MKLNIILLILSFFMVQAVLASPVPVAQPTPSVAYALGLATRPFYLAGKLGWKGIKGLTYVSSMNLEIYKQTNTHSSSSLLDGLSKRLVSLLKTTFHDAAV
jgi:hypothetical protein